MSQIYITKETFNFYEAKQDSCLEVPAGTFVHGELYSGSNLFKVYIVRSKTRYFRYVVLSQIKPLETYKLC